MGLLDNLKDQALKNANLNKLTEQALKKASLVGSGVDAKMMIQEGDVLVNNEPEDRRGRKLFENDTFSFEGVTYQVVKE